MRCSFLLLVALGSREAEQAWLLFVVTWVSPPSDEQIISSLKVFFDLISFQFSHLFYSLLLNTAFSQEWCDYSGKFLAVSCLFFPEANSRKFFLQPSESVFPIAPDRARRTWRDTSSRS